MELGGRTLSESLHSSWQRRGRQIKRSLKKEKRRRRKKKKVKRPLVFSNSPAVTRG